MRPNELRNVRGACIGPSIGTVIMLHTRLRGYPCGTKRGRSKLTSFLCAPRKRFGFSVGRKLLVFSVGIDIDLVFCVWGENDLISV